ncbi:MAG: phosphate ABC transporter permease PstA [Fimbriimonadaceae bacterium]|nr:phosphate ABC transporter permease PstA [Fimbriimonadaceae bacterium]
MSQFSTPQALAHIRRRKRKDSFFMVLMGGASLLAILILCTLLFKIGAEGMEFLKPNLFQNFPGSRPSTSGIKHAIFGTIYLMILTLLLTVPLGVFAALYLEEFQTRKNWFTNLINLNLANLSGVPSIVYGMLGLAIFVPFVAQLAGDPMKGKTLLAGSMTMAILVLPVVILVSQEALKAVPKAYRDGSLAMGATRWQTIRRVVLPSAMPGILTGVILSASRAIGETAPLIVVGAATLVNFVPQGVFDSYGVIPLQIFDWSQRPQEDFKSLAASTIIVLMTLLILLNSAALILRARNAKRV